MSNEAKKTAFKDTMAGPTVVLLLICLVISGALSVVYQVTAPKIEQINKEIADAARLEVLPEADAFTAVEGDLPDGTTEYYIANNGEGVVVTTENKSFGGTITVMTGFDENGTITGVTVTNHSDTAGVGTKAMEKEYLDETYSGRTETGMQTDNVTNIKKDNTEGIDEVSGATVSSNGIYGAVNEAIDAYAEIGGELK